MPQNEPSLLESYDLRLDQLDYGFVRDCSDKQTLERIIRVLRSGEEGSYPHLLRLQALEEELKQWSSHMKVEEEELTRYDVIRAPLPSVRDAREQGEPIPCCKTGQEPKEFQLSEEEKESILKMGHQHLSEGNFLQASLQFQKVLASEPFHPEALKGMAAIHDTPKSAPGSGNIVIEEIL